MKNVETDWMNQIKNIEDWNLGNKKVTLKEVPVKFNKKVGFATIKIEEIIKAEQKFVADENRVRPKQIPILALIYGKMPILHQPNVEIKQKGLLIKEGELRQSRRIHKMLFDIKEKSKEIGYGSLYPSHDFKAEIFGPVSKDLIEELHDLEKNELIVTQWEKGHMAPTVIALTEKGEPVAKNIWQNTPEGLKEIITKTKEFFVFKDINEIVEYFHKRYPEYRKMQTPKDE